MSDEPRRIDPRAARGRLRPEMRPETPPEETAAPADDEGGADPVRRIDPRAERGRRRGRAAAPIEPAARAAAEPRHTIVEDPDFWIAAIVAGVEPWSSAEAEILGVARRLADGDPTGTGNGGVLLLRLGARPGDAAETAGRHGADRLAILPEAIGPEALSSLIGPFAPRHLLFADGVVEGHLARRLAARRGSRPAVGVVALDPQGRAITPSDGGREEIVRALPEIALLARARFAPADLARPREARLLGPAGPIADEPSDLVDLGPLRVEAADVPLAAAEFVVSAGDGVRDWPAFLALARALGAAVGGSRVVCDAGHLPRSRQVGASGTLIEAECYLAFGISGAPQHLQGIRGCRRVVAVDVDPHAAMLARADLAIVADAQAVMPALTRLVTEARE